MSEPNPGGTMAIQVSPADLAQARDMIARFALIVSEVERLQGIVGWDSGVISDLRNDNDQLRLELQQTKDQASLLETQLAGEYDECERWKNLYDSDERTITALNADLTQVKRDRDDIAFKHLEVSEELASANATLDKFRDLLGFPATAARQVEIGAGQEQPMTNAQAMNEMAPLPYTPDERLQEVASTFPSPSPTVEPSPSAAQGLEHGSPDPKVEQSPDESKPWDHSSNYL